MKSNKLSDQLVKRNWQANSDEKLQANQQANSKEKWQAVEKKLTS